MIERLCAREVAVPRLVSSFIGLMRSVVKVLWTCIERATDMIFALLLAERLWFFSWEEKIFSNHCGNSSYCAYTKMNKFACILVCKW